jgi:hypothetical protein
MLVLLLETYLLPYYRIVHGNVHRRGFLLVRLRLGEIWRGGKGLFVHADGVHGAAIRKTDRCDHVLMMAMTGLPTQSSGPKPNCMARERWPKERRSSGLNQRALRRESGDFLCGEVIQRFEH